VRSEAHQTRRSRRDSAAINASASSLHRSRNRGSSSIGTSLTGLYETDEERTERILAWVEDQTDTLTTAATNGSAISPTSDNGPQYAIDSDNGTSQIATTVVDGRSANFTSNSRRSTLMSPPLNGITQTIPPPRPHVQAHPANSPSPYSLNEDSKHYSVTQGRRTGVYPSWYLPLRLLIQTSH
jgi:hypothetical protein